MKRLSTAQTLSLVTLGVVIAVLGTAMIVVWVTLTRSAVAVEQDRIQRSVKQLVAVTVNGLVQARPRYSGFAHDTAVVNALNAPRPATAGAARAVLERISAPTDSGLPIELWTADGKRVAFVGNDIGLGDSVSLNVRGEGPAVDRSIRPGLDAIRAVDSVQLGALYRVADRTYFWLVIPVLSHDSAIGYIAQQRRIAANPQTEATIRELSGYAATGYYHNADHSTWTSFGGKPTVPAHDGAADGMRMRDSVGRVIFAEERVTGTPLVLTMEAPRSVVVAGANATVRDLALLAALLTILGGIAAFWAGTRVARPLVVLSDAAESVARGDFAARVPVAGTREVAGLASSFNTMAEQVGEERTSAEHARESAESASRAKSDFLAAMSHELRTPLNAIGGYTELMEMGLRGPITDDQRRDLSRIRVSQQHLLGLVSRILDLSRIERGEVRYERTSIGVDEMLLGLEELVFPQANEKQQALDYRAAEHNLVVIADREKLRQILLNLLSNAIRHSPNGASITMSAERRGSAAVAMVVSDSGPGIPLDKQASIFEPFVQLDRSLTNNVGGVGLGLAISRDLARGMGGELTVRSAPGEGASFTVTLPSGIHGAKPGGRRPGNPVDAKHASS